MTENKVVIKINYDKPRGKQSDTHPRIVTEWHIGRIIAALALLLIILVPVVYFLIRSDESGERSITQSVASDTQEIILAPEDKGDADVENNEINANLKKIKEDTGVITVKKENEIEKKSENKADIVEQTDTAVKKETSIKTAVMAEKPARATKPVAQTVASGNIPKAQVNDARVTRTMLVKGVNDKEPFGEWSLPIRAEKDRAKGVFFFTEIKNMKGRVLYHRWYLDGKLIYKRKITILGKRWRAVTSKSIPYSGKGHWEARLTDGDGNILSRIRFDVI